MVWWTHPWRRKIAPVHNYNRNVRFMLFWSSGWGTPSMGIEVTVGDDAARLVGKKIKQASTPQTSPPLPLAPAPDETKLSGQPRQAGSKVPSTPLPMLQTNGVPYLPAYRFSSGNKVDIFYDAAEIHPQMEKLLSEAKHSIKLDYFMFSGQEATKLAEMMAAKVKDGVKVQILLDPRLSSLSDMKENELKLIEFMKRSGIEVAFCNYNALPPLMSKMDDVEGRLIDHNKIMIVDDKAAMIGGWNLADKFSHFHDGEVRIDGPAVCDLVQQYAVDWHFATNPNDAKNAKITPQLPGVDHMETAAGESAVRFNSTGINRQNNQWAILENISRAQKSIYVTLIELNDTSIINELIVAKNRGVDVRILLDPSNFKGIESVLAHGPTEWVNAKAVKSLLEAGVQVRYFKSTPEQDVAHAKISIFDGQTLLIGSTDWQTKELCHTSDTAAEVHGGQAPSKAQKMFLSDWKNKSYVAETPAWYKQILSRLYYKFS